MRGVVIGMGEIGKSLFNILNREYTCYSLDRETPPLKGTFDIIHICFPYTNDFIKEVKRYQRKYKPKYTIIHSTVPIGTSRKLNAVHSPIVGIHPNLEKSIITFTKFLGGEQASEVANYFRRANIKVYLTDKPETTELMKILCTTYYGLNIEITKEIKRLCDKYKVPFEMWTLWNDNYNKGYTQLGNQEFVRQNLIPIMTKQGGHCTINNTNLLESILTKVLRDMNKKSI